MGNKTNIYFSTGEFAKLCHVTKHTLFHYDQTGIFSPEVVGENGYRYYSPAQYEVFTVIAVLRELGMPLEEIKAFMDTRSPQNLLQLLRGQEQAIDQKIQELNAMKRLVQEKYKITKRACQAKEETIEMQWEEEETYLLSKPSSGVDDRSFALNMAALVNRCLEQGMHIHHTSGGLRNSADMRAGIYERYSCFYVKVLEEQNEIPQITKEAGTYLVGYHRGSYETVGEAYQRLFAYAETQQLQLDDKIYEELMLDQLSIVAEEQYLLKIFVKVMHVEGEKA